MAVTLTNKPTLIESEDKKLRFLVLDAPSDTNLPQYIKEFQKHNVTYLVRVCQDTYNKEPVERAGIKVIDWPFDDGSSPPANIITKWLELVDTCFPLEQKQANNNSSNPTTNTTNDVEQLPCIACHCVAGLGRAPVLVAIALIERKGMKPLDAISFIRKKRRGAINAKQMQFIEAYKPKNKMNKCKVM